MDNKFTDITISREPSDSGILPLPQEVRQEEMLSVDDRPPQTTADAFVGERCVRPMRRHYSAK